MGKELSEEEKAKAAIEKSSRTTVVFLIILYLIVFVIIISIFILMSSHGSKFKELFSKLNETVRERGVAAYTQAYHQLPKPPQPIPSAGFTAFLG